ncbi:MAG: dihydroorotase [Clostridia bacterium]|nr:dihydroorotase [Clostridia bacterium]
MKITFSNASVFLQDPTIKKYDMLDAETSLDRDVSVDCSKYVIFPGFIDVHVHFREPGFSYKETIASGSAAAARGGYTAVCTMPNLAPVPDSMENLQKQLDIIDRDAAIKVIPFGSITKGEQGQALSDLEDMAPYVCGFSDDGRGVDSTALMREAMIKAKRLGKIISAHCEDGTQIKDSPEAEYMQIERDAALAEQIGVAYHVCHISTAESVDIVRKAKARGVNITCETAPHYLVFSENDVIDDGRFRMNPPIRTERDRLALIEGIKDGTIDMIATDHAPHSAEEKSKGLRSLNGIVGLECAFAVLYTELVRSGIISLERLVELMSLNPAKRFGIAPDGFCVYDLENPYKIDVSEFASMGKCTPFESKEVYGRCIATVCNGKLAYLDNKLN